MADLAQLRRVALNWLSRRDYSELQLQRKLEQQGATLAQIAEVVAWCKAENYLNQQRYIAMLVRSRCNRGYGVNYILQECRQQQISKDELMHCVTQLEIDWFALAQQAYQKKYAATQPKDIKEKYKRMAYLQRRGFSAEQIHHALSDTE